MNNDCHHFSMSMLIFIEDSKRNEHGGGGSFLKNVKFLKFLHSFIWCSMHDLIFKHMNSNMISPKPHEMLKHRVY